MNRTLHFKNKDIFSFLILFFVFLSSLNVINRYYYFIFIAFFIFALKSVGKFYLERSCVPLFLLGMFWVFFSPTSTISVLGIFKPFTYLLCFVMGAGLSNDAQTTIDGSRSYRFFYTLVCTLGGGTLLHYLLNWSINRDVSDATLRNTVDFWSGESLAATGQATLACIPLALAAAALFLPIAKRWKLSALVVLLLILGYNLILAGRSLFILSLIAILGSFIFSLTFKKRGRLKSFVIFILFAVLIFLLYYNDILGIRAFVESSAFYDRFFGEASIDLNDDQRFDRKLFYLQNLHLSPFGGANIRKLRGYSHDLYFDTYDEAGVFAFLALVVYMLSTLARWFRCITAKHLPIVFRQVVFCIYLILYIQFWFEPILQGAPWLFASFCLVDGYVSQILKTELKEVLDLSNNNTRGVLHENR